MKKYINNASYILLSVLAILIVLWLAIWNGIEFIDCDFVLSDTFAIRAIQIVMIIIWGASVCLSPLAIYLSAFAILVFLKKHLKP